MNQFENRLPFRITGRTIIAHRRIRCRLHQGGSDMTVGSTSSHDSANELTSFAADLTDAAYTVVLRHGIGGSWIDLQLDVWRVLAVSIADTQRRTPRLASAAEFLDWRETFV